MTDPKFTIITTTDPLRLPLFADPTPAPAGRRRSDFSLNGSTAMLSVVPPPASPPTPVAFTPATARSGIDWELVARLRRSASQRLGDALGRDGHLAREDQHRLGRSIIEGLLDEEAATAASTGGQAWDRYRHAQVAKAVFDALFGLGRLQPLVDDSMVENVMILGCDNVWVEYEDGTLVKGPPVADTDAELIDFLIFIASRSEVNARAFSEAEPKLHLRLDGGARLAAIAWVTPRPSVVIRRHRLARVTLSDLVARQSLSPLAANFLAAAVRARKSIVVSGSQGAGKTTMMRALCAEIPPHEAIGTFETEYELHLDQMPDRHPIVHAFEAKPGSGELLASGRRAGEYTVDDALYDSFRLNLSRQIVGEVRGREVVAMLKAMQSGAGSMSTTHADDAQGALRKLVTCALEAGVTESYATRAIAEDIDIVVHVAMTTTSDGRGGFERHRWTSEILAVSPGEKEAGFATTKVFASPHGHRAALAATLPDDLRRLADHGFDLAAFYAQAHHAAESGWTS